MSDELAMEMIEKLSEELGEKELKIMALEKALEEEKKEKLEYYDLAAIREYKIKHLEEDYDDSCFSWCPRGIVDCDKAIDLNFDIICKVILHYFGGRIITYQEIIEDIAPEFDHFDWDEFYEDKLMDGDMVCLIPNCFVEEAKFWVDF